MQYTSTSQGYQRVPISITRNEQSILSDGYRFSGSSGDHTLRPGAPDYRRTAKDPGHDAGDRP
ncbi:MAG: hypothetical protein LUQ25_00895 [Methanoregulaceae archaeon]|nr:hypothetical protein [Methanoregulaceae archaeon]